MRQRQDGSSRSFRHTQAFGAGGAYAGLIRDKLGRVQAPIHAGVDSVYGTKPAVFRCRGRPDPRRTAGKPKRLLMNVYGLR
jgi:hypothetical protein